MWKIIDLKYRLSDGVAIEVVAEYRLTDGNLISRKIKSVELDEPTGSIVPFNELTQEQVLSWFTSKVDTQVIEAAVAAELAVLVDKRDNKVIDNKLPWSE